MKFKFKIPAFKIRKKKAKTLRATAVRRRLRATTADYEELAEPNMKLSRALLIVLVLHVVAVSGIIAFNAIKTRQGPSVASEPAKPSAVAPPDKAELGTAGGPQVEIRRAHSATKTADDSHKTYVVAKGDNPVTIAKKLKVSHDDLVALNHIDDPKKLKIGQKLLVPNKAARGKKASE